MKLIISPTVLEVYAWTLFLITLVASVYYSQDTAWAKTKTYLEISSHEVQVVAVSQKMQIVWLHLVYAYAYAFVRVVFTFLILCIVCIWVQMFLSYVRRDDYDDAHGLLNAVRALFDATRVANALFARHWMAHVYGFMIYMVVSFLSVNLVSADISGESTDSDPYVKRIHLRGAILSVFTMLIFYTFYALYVIFLSSQCKI
jgi:hypothetical protein